MKQDNRKTTISKILLRNSEENFLVLKNSEVEEGKWELPGGKHREGENRFQAAKRELKEELGLKVDKLQDVVRIGVEQDEFISCYMLFTDKWQGKPKLEEDKHSKYRWVSPTEFMDMDWHRDAGYNIPPMKYLEEYLN